MNEPPLPGSPREIAITDTAGDQILDGGSVRDTGAKQIAVSPAFDVEKHRGLITILLIALFAVLILGNYACAVW